MLQNDDKHFLSYPFQPYPTFHPILQEYSYKSSWAVDMLQHQKHQLHLKNRKWPSITFKYCIFNYPEVFVKLNQCFQFSCSQYFYIYSKYQRSLWFFNLATHRMLYWVFTTGLEVLGELFSSRSPWPHLKVFFKDYFGQRWPIRIVVYSNSFYN